MKKPRRRRYSDAYRADALAALDANGGNIDRTAADLGVPRATLQGWAAGRTPPPPPELCGQKRGDLAADLEQLARRLCGLPLGGFENLSLRDTAVALGICIDKMLLLRGRPTAITRTETADETDFTALTDDELAARITDLRAAAAAARTDAGADAGTAGPG